MVTISFPKTKIHATNKKVQHSLWGFYFFWHWGQWGRFFWEAYFSLYVPINLAPLYKGKKLLKHP
jgi:hypothetical protein